MSTPTLPATFEPLVKAATTPASFNIDSLLDQMADQTYYVPDYQRDSGQWDLPKKSLFIESLINNLTIPPIIVYPEDDPATGVERNQIVDGQQRITTIFEFIKGDHGKGGFALASEDDVEYADNVGPLIQGKRYSELPSAIQKQISRYMLNFIRLPRNLPLNLRLEVFRRINEGGVPLSAQDLRLALFGESDRVTFLRLVGIYDRTREGASRMIESARRFNLDYPWNNPTPWEVWWDDKAQSAGQAPSQMFLYYCIARDLNAVQTVIASDQIQQSLKLKYDKTIASVLDLYCAQAQNERKPNSPQVLAKLDTLQAWFADFELWFSELKTAHVPKLPVNSSTKVALFIAFAVATWGHPSKVTEKQWQPIQFFLTQGPAKIQQALGIDYPIARGKWPGQLKQIERTHDICRKIAQA